MNSKKKQGKEPWSQRFSKPPSQAYLDLGSSIHFDKNLYKEDIAGTKAHVKMLNSIGVIPSKDYQKILQGLDKVLNEIESGNFSIKKDDEDIHMHIEKRVTELIGEAGAKMHTARSRNDQVITDTMLWLRNELSDIKNKLLALMSAVYQQAEKNIDTIMPGYTHLQVAQPIRLGHHLLAYFEKFSRDFKRLDFAMDSLAECPLGVGAIAGVNYKTDRKLTARELSFPGITSNSMDTVSNRDWILDFHHFASVLFVHLSRFCEELILWSSQEFAFVRLSDSVTTGSSLMPQKRNPDVAELVRGKMGRIVGNHLGLLITLKGLPLTYNRDLQEDKEGLFDSVETVKLSLDAFWEMIASAEFLPENMKASLAKGYSLATDLADYLVEKGIPFRKTHEIVGLIVRHLEQKGLTFEQVDYRELQQFCPEIDKDFYRILDYKSSTDRKKSLGSTSKSSVKAQLKTAKKRLSVWSKS